MSWGDERQENILRAAHLAQVSRVEAVMGTMEYYAIRAVSVMAELLDSDDEQMRYSASKVFIEHILGKPKTKAEISTQRKDLKLYVNMNTEDVLSAWEAGRPIGGS
jgi:hypothetical protein